VTSQDASALAQPNQPVCTAQVSRLFLIEPNSQFESPTLTDNVTSHTVPPLSKPNVRLGEMGGAKDLVLGDGSKLRIAYDRRGFLVFDDVAKFDTRMDIGKYKSLSYTGQMREASRDLAGAIERGEVSARAFTETQLRYIRAGKAQIPGLTWHHHQDTGRLQLLLSETHDGARHVGGGALGGGL
jgi:filamentous hemagglutinin